MAGHPRPQHVTSLLLFHTITFSTYYKFHTFKLSHHDLMAGTQCGHSRLLLIFVFVFVFVLNRQAVWPSLPTTCICICICICICVMQAGSVAILAHYLCGFPWTVGFAVGFLLAAVSLAVSSSKLTFYDCRHILTRQYTEKHRETYKIRDMKINL